MPSIYIDMDDVVADFSGRALEITGYLMPDSGRQKYPPGDWGKFLERPRLYSDLDRCQGADELIEECRSTSAKTGWPLLFLTAVPRDNDFPWAFYDKIQWANRYYPGIPVWFGPYSKDKHRRCQPGDVLIDDRQTNIDMWNSAGGIGILHVSVEQTINELRKLNYGKNFSKT